MDAAAVVLLRRAHSGVLVLVVVLVGEIVAVLLVRLDDVHLRAVEFAIGPLTHAREPIVHLAAVALAYFGPLELAALDEDQVVAPSLTLGTFTSNDI